MHEKLYSADTSIKRTLVCVADGFVGAQDATANYAHSAIVGATETRAIVSATETHAREARGHPPVLLKYEIYILENPWNFALSSVGFARDSIPKKWVHFNVE